MGEATPKPTGTETPLPKASLGQQHRQQFRQSDHSWPPLSQHSNKNNSPAQQQTNTPNTPNNTIPQSTTKRPPPNPIQTYLTATTINKKPRYLSQTTSNEDNIQHQPPTTLKDQCRIATQNMRSNLTNKLIPTIQHMQTHKIDILCLTDTGTTQTDLNISITNAQLKYPGYYFASTPINTPTPKPFTTKRPYTNKLGGVLIIANNTWARSLTGYTTDKTQLGILSKITLHLHGLSPITIIPTYLQINH